jgi:hypothetical protein
MDLFVIGFICGMGVLYGTMLIQFYFPRKPKEDYKPDYEEIKSPVIHEEHFHHVTVNVAIDVPKEELEAFGSDAYRKHAITGKLKLKLLEKIWKFVEIEEEYDPKWLLYRYHAKLLVCLPVRQALKVELEKDTY